MNDLFANYYEFFYTQTSNNFSTTLYDLGLYGTIGIVTILVALAVMAIFYFAINSSRFNKWYHWLLFMGITFTIVFLFTYLHPKGIALDEGYDEIGDNLFLMFGLINGLVASVYYFALSALFKRWSTNCSTTPF